MTNNIDDALHKLHMLTFNYEPCTLDRKKAEEAVNALAWYINTGRAPTGFIEELCNLKGNQRAALLRRMVRTDFTTDSQIEAARAYIHFS